jgi:hypothetical protein
MAEYFCGETLCKKRFAYDGTIWPVKCPGNHDCYPENLRPRVDGREDDFKPNTATLMIADPHRPSVLAPFVYVAVPRSRPDVPRRLSWWRRLVQFFTRSK